MTMSRVIFVGLHNKPNMKPLDSKTKSGQLIDRIIKRLDGYSILKTNLFDDEKLPRTDDEKFVLAKDWYDRVEPEDKDIVVVMGAMTQKHFIHSSSYLFKLIAVAHPASKRSHEGMNKYVEDVLNRITERCSE
jgi:hypothetical protein